MSTIKLRRSATPGNVPTTGQLELGELAINTHDGKLYLKKDDGTASIVDVTNTDLVQDTTPQLGGDLDLNSSDITGTGNIDITGDITSTGNVGIGTASPQAPLDVAGDVRLGANNKVYTDGGNLTISADANNSAAASAVNILVDGTEVADFTNGGTLRFNRAGYVSGGICTQVNDNALNLAGGTNAINSGINIGLSGPDHTAAIRGFTLRDGTTIVYNYQRASDAHIWLTGGFERMRVTSGGAVGIGTTSPNFELEVVSGANADITARSTAVNGYSQVMAAQNDYFSGPSYGSVYLRRYNDGATGTYLGVTTANQASMVAINAANFVIGTNGGAPIIFSTLSTERMRITGAGNVGIGTTDPRSGLHVYGAGQTTANITDAGDQAAFLRVSADRARAGDGGGIIFASLQSDDTGAVGMAAIKGLLVNGTDNTIGDLAFSTRNAIADTALTERMRITSSGSVGIGTASPTAALDIHSNNDEALNIQGNGLKLMRVTSSNGQPIQLRLSSDSINRRIIALQSDGTTQESQISMENDSIVLAGATVSGADRWAEIDANGLVLAGSTLIVGGTNVNVPDYVFADGYPLMPLHEVQAFIAQNNHLPNVPSAAKVKAGGLNMIEMQLALLEKVEELTLYTLQQQKIIDALEQRLKT